MTPKQRQHHQFELNLFWISAIVLALLTGAMLRFVVPASAATICYTSPSTGKQVCFHDAVESTTCFSGVCDFSTPTFLNSSLSDQQKTGSLLIGPMPRIPVTASNPVCDTTALPTDVDYAARTANCARLCLNPVNKDAFGDYSDKPITTDPVNCITSWKSVVRLVSIASGYVQAQGALVQPAQTDIGHVSLTSKGDSGQLMTLIATASGSAPAAVDAEGVTSANYAALFGGTMVIAKKSSTELGTLCLNGSCISNWSDIVKLQDASIVRLQDLRASQVINADTGRTATSGMLVSDFLVAGSANASVPTVIVGPTSVPRSCGDHICTISNENNANCPVDCP